jgi:hypothetical protein
VQSEKNTGSVAYSGPDRIAKYFKSRLLFPMAKSPSTRGLSRLCVYWLAICYTCMVYVYSTLAVTVQVKWTMKRAGYSHGAVEGQFADLNVFQSFKIECENSWSLALKRRIMPRVGRAAGERLGPRRKASINWQADH